MENRTEYPYNTMEEMVAILEGGDSIPPRARYVAGLSQTLEYLRKQGGDPVMGIPGDVDPLMSLAGMTESRELSLEEARERADHLHVALANAMVELNKRAAQIRGLSVQLSAMEDDLTVLSDKVQEALRG